MEGGRGRFCDFDEDSSVGRGHDKFDDFDLPFACEAISAHLIDKLLSPSISIFLLKGFILLRTST